MTTNSYRTRINAAIQAQLTGETVAGDSVHVSLDRPLSPESDLPAILIYTQAARRGPVDYGNSLIPRVVHVTIEAAISSDPLNAINAALVGHTITGAYRHSGGDIYHVVLDRPAAAGTRVVAVCPSGTRTVRGYSSWGITSGVDTLGNSVPISVDGDGHPIFSVGTTPVILS